MSSRSFRSMALYILLPLGIAGLVVALSIYLSSSGWSEARSHTIAKGSEPVETPAAHAAQKFACPVSLKSNSNTGGKQEVEHRAQQLMEGKRFDEALASFRELAGMDPAFPGVNLDISMALSKLHQTAAAKQAVDSQLSLSMCLAQLFPNELEPYCRAEGFSSTSDCIKELGSIQQGAYIQAALVQMDAEHKDKSKDAIETARVHVPEPLLKAAGAPAGKPLVVARMDEAAIKLKRAPGAAKNSLASGMGTDAALGAYSK